MTQVLLDGTFSSWQQTARKLIARNFHPRKVNFVDSTDPQAALFSEEILEEAHPLKVPRAFADIAHTVSNHRDPKKWDLLYRILFRLLFEEPKLLQILSDPDIVELHTKKKAIDRDVHKMHAFVRFKQVRGEDDAFVAWYEPDHLILPLAAPFFARRFATMRWSIFTPDGSAFWDTEKLNYAPGISKSEFGADPLETLWKTYYASIFNPARVKVRAMKKEMPKRFWKNLPETDEIEKLLGAKEARVDSMLKLKRTSAEDFVPLHADSLETLAAAATHCQGCPLYQRATQVVFGQGSAKARVVFVGEQPGDVEDREGKPFVGPAGKVLEQILKEIQFPTELTYVTNAVKHFSWKPQGKRRLHQKPRDGEIAACQPWLTHELDLIRPEILVCLGATAARSVFGKIMKIESERGRFQRSSYCEKTLITYHPSAALRAFNEEARLAIRDKLMEDLKKCAGALA